MDKLGARGGKRKIVIVSTLAGFVLIGGGTGEIMAVHNHSTITTPAGSPQVVQSQTQNKTTAQPAKKPVQIQQTTPNKPTHYQKPVVITKVKDFNPNQNVADYVGKYHVLQPLKPKITKVKPKQQQNQSAIVPSTPVQPVQSVQQPPVTPIQPKIKKKQQPQAQSYCTGNAFWDGVTVNFKAPTCGEVEQDQKNWLAKQKAKSAKSYTFTIHTLTQTKTFTASTYAKAQAEAKVWYAKYLQEKAQALNEKNTGNTVTPPASGTCTDTFSVGTQIKTFTAANCAEANAEGNRWKEKTLAQNLAILINNTILKDHIYLNIPDWKNYNLTGYPDSTCPPSISGSVDLTTFWNSIPTSCQAYIASFMP